jgi:uncharacterized protein involved in exopolysaccharide biosynthesis
VSASADVKGTDMPRSRIVLIVVCAVVGAAAGFSAALLSPTLYASTATLMVIPTRVPDFAVPARVAPTDATRLVTLQQQVLSRTRLERMMHDFELYTAESHTVEKGDRIALMRDRIIIDRDGDAVRVGFVHDDPRLAQRVAERLAALMVEENLRDRQMRLENTNRFLDSQTDEARKRLDQKHAELADLRRQGRVPRSIELDVEVLETRYRALSSMSEEARMAINVEKRQIGEQFKMIEAAPLPDHPMARGRHKLSLVGGGIGLLAGLGLAFVRRARA